SGDQCLPNSLFVTFTELPDRSSGLADVEAILHDQEHSQTEESFSQWPSFCLHLRLQLLPRLVVEKDLARQYPSINLSVIEPNPVRTGPDLFRSESRREPLEPLGCYCTWL